MLTERSDAFLYALADAQRDRCASGVLSLADSVWLQAMHEGVPVPEPAAVKNARENFPWCETMAQALTRFRDECEEEQRVAAQIVDSLLDVVVIDAVTEEISDCEYEVSLKELPTVSDISIGSLDQVIATAEVVKLTHAMTRDVVDVHGGEERIGVHRAVSDTAVSSEENAICGGSFAEPIKFGSLWFDLASRPGKDPPVCLRHPVPPEYTGERDSLAARARVLDREVDHGEFAGFGLYVCYCGDSSHGVTPDRYCYCGGTSAVYNPCWCAIGHVAEWARKPIQVGTFCTVQAERTLSSYQYHGIEFYELAQLPRAYRTGRWPDTVKYWVRGGMRVLLGYEPGDRFDALLQTLGEIKITAVVVHKPGGIDLGFALEPGEFRSFETIVGYCGGQVVFVVYAANAMVFSDRILRFLFVTLSDDARVFSVCKFPYL